jgi:hypothetical protein
MISHFTYRCPVCLHERTVPFLGAQVCNHKQTPMASERPQRMEMIR